MATCEPALAHRAAEGRQAGQQAGWVGRGGSVDVTAEALRGGKPFPLVTSPGVCANLGTQCYH